MRVLLDGTHAAVAKGYSDALVRRRSRVQFPSAALFSNRTDRCGCPYVFIIIRLILYISSQSGSIWHSGAPLYSPSRRCTLWPWAQRDVTDKIANDNFEFSQVQPLFSHFLRSLRNPADVMRISILFRPVIFEKFIDRCHILGHIPSHHRLNLFYGRQCFGVGLPELYVKRDSIIPDGLAKEKINGSAHVQLFSMFAKHQNSVICFALGSNSFKKLNTSSVL